DLVVEEEAPVLVGLDGEILDQRESSHGGSVARGRKVVPSGGPPYDRAMQLVERRHRRSERIGAALTYQLEHVTDVEDLHAFVLADRNGLALATASAPTSALDVEELSALCPLLGEGRVQREAMDAALGDGRTTEIMPVDIDGELLYLLCVAGARDAAERSARRAAPGVRRRLGRCLGRSSRG